MVIDTGRTTIRMRLRGFITAIIFFILILVFLVFDIFDDIRMYLVIIFSFCYIVFILHIYLKDYFYIYFSDESNKMVFRYYSMRPLSQTKRSIEIPRGSLARYEIRSEALGFKNKIIFYQKIKDGVYKYPPVSITILSSQEKDQLLQALNNFL
jgi:energy-coupling factor transporter transmembrane protein EcfT